MADITSLINLIITMLKTVTFLLLNKKMNKDIIRNIMIMDGFKECSKISFNKKSLLNQKLNNINKDKTTSDFEEKQNSKEFINLNNIKLKDKKLKERKIKVLKNLNCFDIIKSFFCFKNAKKKLLNYFDNKIL